ncbi:SGNH/GDSL hydrolase family protein [Spirosoma endophyticum]|uniref:SGNH/GDSL hydrolase family protein n=1 Tax=Spirosoma endophyticum TaxID=662367 RepID=A0A1I1YLV8_9BACT|nr:hypothetical protein [Spirosoma endophyticum]SFE20028.1 hypothetical protein SAMN05216167_11191 [Spirosoma endophyticum]
MNVVVIGGCHVDNYGVQSHLGFVQQWATHLKISTHEAVHINCLSMVKVEHIPSLISQYHAELMDADLIILQLGHYELSWRKRFSELFQAESSERIANTIYRSTLPKSLATATFSHKPTHTSQREQLKNGIKTAILSTYYQLGGEIPFLNQFRNKLTKALTLLSAYQDKIVVLTPFPTLNKLDQWLRKKNNSFIIESALEAGLNVADTFDAVPRQKAYFLADGVHLNSLGHMIIALYLSELPLLTYHAEQPT